MERWLLLNLKKRKEERNNNILKTIYSFKESFDLGTSLFSQLVILDYLQNNDIKKILDDRLIVYRQLLDETIKNINTEKKAFFLLLGIMAIYYGFRMFALTPWYDELYTYYSTNKTAGVFVEDRTWMEGEELRNEFVVLEGEEFRYSVVKMMQSWDVHPPFYYYLIHTVSSLSPGVFSKWQGIVVNLIAYVLSFYLLAKVVFTALTISGGVGEKEKSAGSCKRRRI